MTVPFQNPNSRIFFACQGVFVEERNTETEIADPTANSVFLDGVQAIGVSSTDPSNSLPDTGRFQRRYTQYGQKTVEITLERVIPKGSDFFYKVTPLQYTDYQQSHLLNAENLRSKGAADNNSKVLRNYDITILQGGDQFTRFYDGVGGSDPDASNVISTTYTNCLITNINYTIAVDGVRESVTLTTKNIRYNDDYSDVTQYNWPPEYTEVDPEDRTGESGSVLRRKDFDLTEYTDTNNRYGNSKLPTEVKELFNFDDAVLESGLQVLGIQSISIEVSIDYSELADVGNWRGSEDGKEYEQNRWTSVNIPVSTTCSFTGVVRQVIPYSNFLTGDENKVRNVDNVYTKSLADPLSTDWQEADREIRIVALGNESPQEYFVWDLGGKNHLTSIEYSGGDTGGGNVEATINYQNQYSDFVPTKTTSVLDLTNTGPY